MLVLKFKAGDVLKVVSGGSIAHVTVEHIGENAVKLTFQDVEGPQIEFRRLGSDMIQDIPNPVRTWK
jgi:hypothetical protein